MLAGDEERHQPALVNRNHVVITGGHGDLASAIAAEFMAYDYQVSAPGRDELDVSNELSVSRYFTSHNPGLLVCCAGAIADSLLSRTGLDDWERAWVVNYTGAKRCAEAAHHAMSLSGKGHIIFVSSHSALHPPVGQAAYAAAKRALLGLTRDMASRYGADNIRVNAILPGFLENRMTATVGQPRRERVLADHCLGRFNTMDRVAAFVRFLHEEMPHTSGQWFQLDSRDSLL